MLIPVPKWEVPETEIRAPPTNSADYERIKKYMDCPDWKCHCGAVMFGRCKECVYCRIRNNTHSPKPY